jgi:hypothetical protein
MITTMKKIYILMAAAAMMLTMNSCRETSDDVASYGQYDVLTFEAANTSFTGQFKGVWTALNCNYGIWDYEAEYGLNWDDVYSHYMPKMEELDKRDKSTNPVTDAELEALYKEIAKPLHDGHFALQVKNLHTGSFIMISPSTLRNADRPDANLEKAPSFDYYKTAAAGENQVSDYKDGTAYPTAFINEQIENAKTQLNAIIATQQAKVAPTDLDDYLLQKNLDLKTDLDNYTLQTPSDIEDYNTELVPRCVEAGIPIQTFDIDQGNWIKLEYAMFKDNIAYLKFNAFAISGYVKGAIGGTPNQDYLADRLRKALAQWTDTIQSLHKTGQLKGVIIDVRNNGGGNTGDYQYVLGSMLPSGGHTFASARFKTGIGRFDYSPLTPEVFKTREDAHETITEPIVVLANGNSVSMAEITSLGAKAIPNARLIGTRTHGGLCLLMSDPSAYSVNYASSVGIQNQTPFWAYIPANTTISNDYGILEGIGVTPDFEVQLDQNLLQTTGRDNQLERALLYIRTGN